MIPFIRVLIFVPLVFFLVSYGFSQTTKASKIFGRPTALGMQSGDILRIHFESNGCFHHTTHDLVITRSSSGASLTGTDHSPSSDSETKISVEDRNQRLKTVTLKDSQLASVDRSFEYCRTDKSGHCTTIDEITLVHERGGQVIAREKFRDATCQLDASNGTLGFWTMIRMITPKIDD